MVRLLSILVFGLMLLTLLAWWTSTDLKFNPASFEDQPVTVGIAPLSEALSIAQFKAGSGDTRTLLVLEYDGQTVSGLDLSVLGSPNPEDPFKALNSVDRSTLIEEARNADELTQIPISDLLPSGPHGGRHIGSGTNFPEHAEESSSDLVFQFPKFGAATPARTSVSAPSNGLLDYEVEICIRFDRPIAKLADFAAAQKAFFLCADFTDRIAIVELVDEDNLDSGYGFSDAKSGKGFFPTGPFLVLPNDWKSFVADIRMTTEVNTVPRQDARGHEMIMNFEELIAKALDDMDEKRFLYQDNFYRLSPNAVIEPDMALMSGTSEGVIFTPLARHDYIEILGAYLIKGGPLGVASLDEFGRQAFIAREIKSGHFLQPGDEVLYRSNTLGEIVVEVTQ